jgi:hypothetical protein
VQMPDSSSLFFFKPPLCVTTNQSTKSIFVWQMIVRFSCAWILCRCCLAWSAPGARSRTSVGVIYVIVFQAERFQFRFLSNRWPPRNFPKEKLINLYSLEWWCFRSICMCNQDLRWSGELEEKRILNFLNVSTTPSKYCIRCFPCVITELINEMFVLCA